MIYDVRVGQQSAQIVCWLFCIVFVSLERSKTSSKSIGSGRPLLCTLCRPDLPAHRPLGSGWGSQALRVTRSCSGGCNTPKGRQKEHGAAARTAEEAGLAITFRGQRTGWSQSRNTPLASARDQKISCTFNPTRQCNQLSSHLLPHTVLGSPQRRAAP